MAQVDKAQAAMMQIESGLMLAKSGVVLINAEHRNLLDLCENTKGLNEDIDKIISKIDSALRVKKKLHQCFIASPGAPVAKIGT